MRLVPIDSEALLGSYDNERNIKVGQIEQHIYLPTNALPIISPNIASYNTEVKKM